MRRSREASARAGPRSSATSATRSSRFGRSRGSALAAVVFYELLRFQRRRTPARSSQAVQAQLDALTPTDRVRPTLVAARAVLGVAAVAARRSRRASTAIDRVSIHLGESAEEVEFLRDRRRPVARAARGARRVESGVAAARLRSRSSTSSGSGFSTPRLLAVHGVQLTDAELDAAGARAARRS